METERQKTHSRMVFSSFSQTLKGKVKFDFGLLSNPAFGTVHVHGEFPRLRPRFQNQKLALGEQESIVTLLEKWAKNYFDFSDNKKYYGGMVECVATYTPYMYPVPNKLLVLKLLYWVWVFDNIFEVLIVQKPISADTFEDGCIQLLRLLQNDSTVVFRGIPKFPGFRSLFLSFQDLLPEIKDNNSNYLEGLSLFHFSMERFFGAMRMAYVTPIDDKWSEDSFRHWNQTCLSYYDTIPTCFWIVDGEKMPPKIRNSPSLRRILDLLNSIGGYTNDLLGMIKDFKKNENDNFVFFKVIHKKDPLETVIENVCELIKEELEEFILLRNALLQKFDYDPILVKYVDMIEATIDGNTKLLCKSMRHQAAGLIELTG